ncbi:uncharacterized protein DUF4241 [Streptomyces sp. 3211.6]|uniref:DUF4241 domain-containing protein n=1 Tax=Streptomyces TaxID=1883 RepID=UPI0009A54742|nr:MULTISPECIES: DUF4241 domain-containing protein [Streptomyces]RKT02223.1 uncharacterized protein DUF4241 [Streptomyces sp. 3211.6]RPF43539.1 uncharacterized protein DUF4241 [Streptomyces sp. Ag109_G2-6]
MVVEVGYAQAWDPQARAAWRPLSSEEARERDAAGLPYVVVYRTAGRDVPLEVRLVSWRDHHVGLWVYDVQGRRTHDLDLRLLDDPERLFHRYSVAWNYPAPETAEFDPECPRVILDLFPDGRGRRVEEPRGYATSAGLREDERWMERPAFGEWPLLSAQLHGFTEPPPIEAAVVLEGDVGEAPASCWRPPRPAQPGRIGKLFRPGVRVTDGYHPEQTVVEPHRVGTVRVPSGLLAVSGLFTGHENGPHITVPVPPGEYVLDEARVAFSYHCEWRNAEVETTEPTAVRLLLSETPAASWEMALGADDDRRIFIEKQIAGFDTDGATGCFADAGSFESLLSLFERGLIDGEPDLDGYEDLTDGSMFIHHTWDTATGGELMAFATTGDGTYPVWLGRCEAGELVSVVVLIEGMPEILPERDGVAADV